MPITLNEEFLVFYQELGTAIMNWAHVELSICGVVTACLPSTNARTLAAGYFAIENFRSKLKFANDTIHEELTDSSHLDAWANLFKRTESLAQQRNKLIHRVLTVVPALPPGKRAILLPPNPNKIPPSEFVSVKGKPRLPPDSICVLNVVEMRIKFGVLWEALTQFGEHVAGAPAPTQALLEQPIDVPNIADLVGRIRSLLESPPPPSSRSQRK